MPYLLKPMKQGIKNNFKMIIGGFEILTFCGYLWTLYLILISNNFLWSKTPTEGLYLLFFYIIILPFNIISGLAIFILFGEWLKKLLFQIGLIHFAFPILIAILTGNIGTVRNVIACGITISGMIFLVYVYLKVLRQTKPNIITS